MSELIRKYSISKQSLQKASYSGFTIMPECSLDVITDLTRHTLFLKRIDSGVQNTDWGRLCFDANLSSSMVITTRALASDAVIATINDQPCNLDDFIQSAEIPLKSKIKLFESAYGTKSVGVTDMLLYTLHGRYIWIFIDIQGSGIGNISNIRLYTHGDNFMATFPEIYRQPNSFFHRYISIFSSIYNDLSETTANLDKYVNIDTAPARLLPLYASFLGLELGESYLDETILRKLVQNAFTLIKYKGTKIAIEMVLKIFVDTSFYIVENSSASSKLSQNGMELFQSIYGTSRFDCTILINSSPDEELHKRLKFFIDQVKPVRARVNIAFIKDGYMLDSYCFLDMNASTLKPKMAALDCGIALNGTTTI